MKNPNLWEKLQNFQFDAEEGSQPYSVKLAESAGWEPEYTARVIEEYRRFIYLAQVAEHEVTPSAAVDQAWHTHLTFTRSYWEDLCDGILGAPFHHEPCKGSEDMPRYNDQYEKTRALYAEEFGHPPPDDIWRTDDGSFAFVQRLVAINMVLGSIGFALSLLWLVVFGINMYAFVALVTFGLIVIVGFAPKSKSRGQAGNYGGVAGCGAGKNDGGGGGAGCGGGGCGGGGG